ncbi:aldo/keto reductase [Tropicimonas sp. TH_r6]|uniref:aldo/keto reductase n=1 Tax=Tropicimonas sp. TH_r6 TaxID=3082085 RepID=UPI002955466D|nr:aldo/keto reductase [Tropicimonas sp. TH_r6]MDV7144044.1 aldo/keto reductase [Tropicimonas sp. TH_r6]
MEYRRLGDSGAIVSQLALGAMTFGDEADEQTSRQLMSDFVAAGGNFIDTADVYSNGLSEEIVGRWLADHPADADKVVLTTKARFPMGDGPNDLGLSRVHLRKALEASLKRLKVEFIDLYQMHAWDALTPIDETLRFLDDAISAGKIGHYGVSNFLGWQLTKAVHVARARGFSAPVTLQPQYNLLVRGIEFEIVPAALDAGIGLLPWSPLGGGWLSGKYQRDETPRGESRLGEQPDRGMEAYAPRNAEQRTWAILDAVQKVAERQDCSMAQVALAWLLAQPAVTSVLVGARNSKQLADNLAAADLELSLENLKLLNEISAPAHGVYPYGSQADQQRHRKIGGGF